MADIARGDLFFFYGSLRQGLPLWEELSLREADVVLVAAGSVPGRLHDLGSYPGLVGPGEFDDPEDRVEGEVFRIGDAGVAHEIDALERGSGYERHRRPVRTTAGEVEAWVYVYTLPVSPDSRVEGGDWKPHWARKLGLDAM